MQLIDGGFYFVLFWPLFLFFPTRSGMFVVGPESAGAHPGPACYRKGDARFTSLISHKQITAPQWGFCFNPIHPVVYDMQYFANRNPQTDILLVDWFCGLLGGPLTVTDANLALGRLLPSLFPKIFGPAEDEPLSLEDTMKHFHQLTDEINHFLSSSQSQAPIFTEMVFVITWQ